MNLAEIASQKADVAGLVGGARSGLELPEISPARGAKGTGDGVASSAKTDVAFGKSKRRTSIYDHVDHTIPNQALIRGQEAISGSLRTTSLSACCTVDPHPSCTLYSSSEKDLARLW